MKVISDELLKKVKEKQGVEEVAISTLFRELIYAGKEVEDLIKVRFPTVKITDASDCVHEERFEIEIENIAAEEFYVFSIKEGFAMVCFGFQMMTFDPDEIPTLKEWIVKAETLQKENKNEPPS